MSDALRAHIETLDLDQLRKLYATFFEDSCADEDRAQQAALKVLTEEQVYGNRWGVHSVADVVEILVAEVEKLRAYQKHQNESAQPYD